MSRLAPSVSLMTALSLSVIAALAGCQRETPADASQPVAAATAPAPDIAAPPTAEAAYKPPTAEQLYALVAPIALFPDRLVAQTLAASTHPDEIGAARDFLGQNASLTGAGLVDAADAQPWDPSVKSLVPFPAVLDQLANNPEWTAALGAAYASEPTDVMNAIQVMRGRARAHGALKSSPQQTVEVSDRGPPVDETVAEDDGVVPAPAQTILIEPAENDVVYVPEYDPDVVYGEPIVTRVYSNGWYEAPPSRGELVTTGLISFGAGILVGQIFASHEHRESPRWGWNAWNTSWGGGRPGNPHYGRPAIVYDNHPYTVNRTTVINRTVNIDRSTHIDNRHNFNNVNVDARRSGPPIPAAPGPGQRPGVPAVQGQRPGGFAAASGRPTGAPDYAHMQRPNFTADMTRPTAANARPTLPPRPVDAQPGRLNDPRVDRNAQAGGREFAGRPIPPAQPGRGTLPAAPQVQAPRAEQQHFEQRARPQPQARPQQAPRSEPQHFEQRAQPQPQPQQAPRAEPQHVEQRAQSQPQAQPRQEQREQPRPQVQQPRPEPQRESRPQPQPQQRAEPQHENRPQPQPQHHEAPQQRHDKHDDHGG